MSKAVHRGDIWVVDWSPGRGSEQSGMRRALVVQTAAANSNPRYPNTIVVAMSTKGRPVPFHVLIEPSDQNGLEETSFAKCEQVLTISKERLVNRLGHLDEDCLRLVVNSLRKVLEI